MPEVATINGDTEQAGVRLEEAERKLQETLEQLEERTREAEALRQVAEIICSGLPLEEMLQKVADIAVETTATESCLIYLLDEERDELVLRAARDEAKNLVRKVRLKFGEGITGWVARERQPVVLPRNAFTDVRHKPIPELQTDKYHSRLSVPLIDREHQVIGVVNVRSRAPRQYSASQIRLLETIAKQVGSAIETSLHVRSMETRITRLSTLSEVSKTITSNLYLEEILELIVAMTAKTMNFKICSIMLLDENKGELVIKATQSQSKEYVKKPNLKMGESIAGQAVVLGKPLAVLDVQKIEGYRYPDIAKKEGLRSLICMPLKVKEKTIGVLNCYTDKPHTFTEEEVTLLSALANQAAIAIANAKLMVRSAIVQEMHHRVKNNLQTIASLLRLQITYKKQDESVADVLNESINRILSIAAVHEMLSREDLDCVSVKKIGESILAAVKQSLVGPHMKIDTFVSGPDLMLPSHQATSVSLILNELAQNAVEHGFEGLEHGSIRIDLTNKGEEVVIEVTNDGRPVPPGFDLKSNRNLGLRIVDNLVRDDLGGRFSLENAGGLTKATIAFPK
ncbi:MAG: GAF domain-containing protein [Armatimonadetes bacterium]|nr:GAF domain-containing protein [Armatimonadota bacterium]